MKKRNIIVGILVLVLILFLFIIFVFSRKKAELKSPPQTETNTNIGEYAENEEQGAFETNEANEVHEEDKEEQQLQPEEPIETVQPTPAFKEFRLASVIDKANYEITNVKKSSDDKKTSITGKIKNNGGSEKIVLKVEFKEQGNVKSSSSIEINNLKQNQTQDFEIKMLNNSVTDDYQVLVNYVGE